jgi:hypothetical protein
MAWYLAKHRDNLTFTIIQDVITNTKHLNNGILHKKYKIWSETAACMSMKMG